MQNSSGLVLFVCAGLLLSGGAILGGSTTWSLVRISYYFWVTDLGVELAASVLFICGALLCLPTCWVATLVPYQPKSLTLSATLLFLGSAALALLAAGLVAGGGLSRAVRDRGALNATLLRAAASRDPAVQGAFAAMQLELHCCGVESYLDWYHHRPTLPPSCCGRVTNLKGEKCESALTGAGCLRRAALELRAYINSITILASVIIIVLVATLSAAAHTLVTAVSVRDARASKPPPPLRIACFAPHCAPPSPPAPLAPLSQPQYQAEPHI